MLKTSQHKDEFGFTLVELLVGITIFGLTMSLSMSSYREWIQNSRIRNVAESIQSGLQLARAEAVKRNTPVQFALGSGSEWAVGCVTATAECPAIIQSRSANEGSSSGITLDVVPAGKQL